MTVFAIYDGPPELPGHFVVKRWIVREWGFYPERIGCVSASLEEARTSIPTGLKHGKRCETDRPEVVEVWM